MDDSTRQIIHEDQSTLQEVQTEETPTHDVIKSDEHDLLAYFIDASPYVDSESDNECRRPTPSGRKYWIPDVPVEEKPTEGDVFDNFDEAYNMYLEYSQKARFSIRKSTTKRKNGNITHKYILCSKDGKPRKTIVKDTLVQDNQKEVDQNEGAKKSQKNHYLSFTVTDCKAVVRFKAIHGTNCYKLYDFVENHNHPLVDENNLDNLRARRKLDFSDKVFIHRVSLSDIGPTKAHRLRVAFIGRYHKTVNDELSRMFWADETMKCKYIAFGDVVSFDATYHTSNDETFHSYTWLLTAFKQAHGKEPLMAVTYQDAALRNAIEFVFPESHHRLCMWYITQKICGDVENDSEFKKLFHKLIWNVHIGPEEFEQRWHALIGMFNLSANSWLSEMFEIRDRWIPGYFKDLPMCCLMKTTSRSESSNAFFRIHSHQGNMLVQFMLCFEAAMEKQRYTQRIADNRTFESTPVMFTALAIERFACQVYSRSIFREVVINELDGSITCSCNHFRDMDTFCRLWEEGHKKKSLTEFLATVKCVEEEFRYRAASGTITLSRRTTEDYYRKGKLLGVTTPNEVVVKVPKGIRNKGCGTGGARFIGPGEKAKNKAKTKQQGRSCSICFETGHNMRTCKRNKLKGKEIVVEESEDEEQADDNDTSDHATSDTE
ncbi:FAR1-related sequence 5-like protein [Tanacetum coccineum]|uniref:FAR1-related sequence 5-like protein n=1 Tax=Tanacetum coccineum TaxID=301880 RepID=A0ABQ5FX11_9ASTR